MLARVLLHPGVELVDFRLDLLVHLSVAALDLRSPAPERRQRTRDAARAGPRRAPHQARAARSAGRGAPQHWPRTYVMSNSSESTSRGRTGPSARLKMMVCSRPARPPCVSAPSHSAGACGTSRTTSCEQAGRRGGPRTAQDLTDLVLLQFLRRTAVKRWRKAGCLACQHTTVHDHRTKVGRLFTSQFDMPACRHSARPYSLSAWLVKLLVQAGFLHKQQASAHCVGESG